jgi:preprotein translocase subunit SecD
MRFFGFAAGGLALWIALSAAAVVASGAFGGPTLSLGLDLQSGARLVYAAEGASPHDLELAADVVRRRIASIDSDAQVYVDGDRIAIELEGSDDDAADARELIADNAHLEFRAIDDAFDVASRVPSPPSGVTTESEVVPIGHEDPQHRTTYFAATGPGARERLRSIAPALDLGARELLIGERTAWERVEGAPSGFRTYVAERAAPVDGTMVADAYASLDPNVQVPTRRRRERRTRSRSGCVRGRCRRRCGS